MSKTLNEQTQDAFRVSAKHVTSFYLWLRELVVKKPNSLELFLTLNAAKAIITNTSDNLWKEMEKTLPDNITKEQSDALKEEFIVLSSTLATDPDVQIPAKEPTINESKLWRPNSKKFTVK